MTTTLFCTTCNKAPAHHQCETGDAGCLHCDDCGSILERRSVQDPTTVSSFAALSLPPVGSHWWLGTTTDGSEWQCSDGPAGKRGSSRDFSSASAALAWVCKPGVTVTFESDFVPPPWILENPSVHFAVAIDALTLLVATVNQTGGMLQGEDLGDGENEDAPAGDPDWVDLGNAYLLACEALGKEPDYRIPTSQVKS